MRVLLAVLGLILSFASEVQEFSVAGNIVKLKEVKKDVEHSIGELKAARTETFRFLLSLAKRFPGGWSNGGTVDNRLHDFWILHHQIVEFKCKSELIGRKYLSKGIFPEPETLTIDTFEPDSIESTLKRGVAGGDAKKLKGMLTLGLNEYRKLYELYVELKNVTSG